MTSPLEAALTCAENGWRVFPCYPGRKNPRFETWESVATSDKAQIAAWAEQFPGCNWGVACGPSGLLVVDVDVRGGKPGMAALAALEAAHGPLPKTLKVRTPSGGWHFYFGGSGRTTASTALGKGIDTRGHGGLVLLPGSMFEGRTYEVIQEAAPAPLPGWIAAKLDAPKVHNVDLSELEGRSRLTDEEVLALLANDEKAARLLDGDWVDDYPSQSEADLALCSKLSFYCGRDPDQVDRIFRDSLLMREKWDREDYRLNTLARACGNEAVHPRQVDPASALALLTGIGPGKAPLPPVVPKTIDASDLLTLDLPPVRWVIEGLLPAGLSVIGGKPKVGKSWLALQLGLAVVRGEPFLGFSVAKGQALYLALEDSNQRLQSRLQRLLDKKRCPKGLVTTVEWPRFDEAGLAALDAYLADHCECKLVIVDVLAKARPMGKANKDLNAYERDYLIASALKKVADKHNVCVLGITHLRKQGGRGDGGDVYERLSGSTGFPAAADVVMVLDRARGGQDAVLHATGRDVETVETLLVQDTQTLAWTSLGPNTGSVTSPDRVKILHALEKHGELRPSEIGEIAKLDVQYVKNTLPELLKSGLVCKPRHGVYTLMVTAVGEEDEWGDL